MLPNNISDRLQKLAKKSKNAKERERLRALYAISVGYPLPTVAEIFSVDEGTVYRWIERWQEEKTLSDKPKIGRPGSLTKEDKQTIKQLIIEGNPKAQGIDANFWNTKELREYFSKKGKNVSQETIRRCLKEIGAKYIKTEDKGKKEEEFAWQFVEDMKFMPYTLVSLFEEDNQVEDPPKRSYWTFDKRNRS